MKMKLITGLSAALLALSSSVALAQDNNDTDENTEEESVELDTMVVVGGRVEQNIEDVAGSVSVMTGKDIEDQMVSDMSQLFRYEPGIEITGSNGTSQNFIVRGMGSDRVMMIKDGMRMNEGYGADGANDVVGRGFIDIDTLKQVEVAKGAASSLYGADAMGGIVAFATKDAGDLLGGESYYVSANADYDGRSDEFGAGIMTAFRLGSLETLVSFNDRSGSETENYTDTRQKTNVDSNSLLVKTDYIFSDNQKLTFSYDYYKQDVERPDDGSDKGNWQGLTDGGDWTINSYFTLNEKENNAYKIRFQSDETKLGFVDTLDVNLYFNKSDQVDQIVQNYDTPLYGPGVNRDQLNDNSFQQETWGLSLSASKSFGTGNAEHQLSYGFDYDTTDTIRNRQDIRTFNDGTINKDDLSAPFPMNTTDRLGVYLQDTIKLGERFSLIPGIRYDDYSMDPKQDENFQNGIGNSDFVPEKIADDNISWRLGAIYDFTEYFSGYLQYSQGFKVPPYDLAYFQFDHVVCDFVNWTCIGISIVPAENLVPEESDSYEVGIRGSYGKFSYSLSAYRSDYENFIQIVQLETIIGGAFGLGDTYVSQYQNIESTEISGMEFRFDYDLSNNVSVFLNGEWMDSEDKETGEQLANIQPFNGTLGASYYQGDFSMDAMLKWADKMDKTPTGALSTGGYVTLDLYGRYEFNDRFQLNVGMMNVFDKNYMRYSSVAGVPDNGQDLSLRTQPGRTVSARVKFVF